MVSFAGGRTGSEEKKGNEDFLFDDKAAWLSMNENKWGNPWNKVYVICRLGNDSQLAVKILEEHGIGAKDVVGGLHEWSNRVDTDFPTY